MWHSSVLLLYSNFPRWKALLVNSSLTSYFYVHIVLLSNSRTFTLGNYLLNISHWLTAWPVNVRHLGGCKKTGQIQGDVSQMSKRTAVLRSLSQGRLRVFKFPLTLFHLILTTALMTEKNIQEVDQIATKTAAMEQWWPHASWSCDGAQAPAGRVGWDPLSGEGLRRKHAAQGWGSLFSCSGSIQAHHCAFGFIKTNRDPVHTVSILGGVTGPKCLLGEDTGRKACSMPGLEKSGKILCSRANLQVKMISVK